ncbi:MAG: hypothetical protein AB8A39_04370 [Prochlorococcus sp.]
MAPSALVLFSLTSFAQSCKSISDSEARAIYCQEWEKGTKNFEAIAYLYKPITGKSAATVSSVILQGNQKDLLQDIETACTN